MACGGWLADAERMSRENVEAMRRAYEAYLAPDVEWHHNIGLGTPMEGIYHGFCPSATST